MHKGGQSQVNQYDDSDDEGEEAQSDNEPKEASKKAPNQYVQMNHLEEKILCNSSDGVQTRRRLAQNDEQVKFYLMTEVEPKTFNEAHKEMDGFHHRRVVAD